MTDVFTAVFSLTKAKSKWEGLNVSEEEAASAGKLLEKLAEVTRNRDRLDSLVTDYSKRLKESTEDLDTLKVGNK